MSSTNCICPVCRCVEPLPDHQQPQSGTHCYTIKLKCGTEFDLVLGSGVPPEIGKLCDLSVDRFNPAALIRKISPSIENLFAEKTITDIWTFYDIQDRIRGIMNDADYILDLSVGNKVLELMERNYDASIGYNWGQVDYWYDFVMNGKH